MTSPTGPAVPDALGLVAAVSASRRQAEPRPAARRRGRRVGVGRPCRAAEATGDALRWSGWSTDRGGRA